MQYKGFVVLWIAVYRFYTCYACSMEGVSNWLLPVSLSIYDTDRGVFFRRSTSNIEGIISVTNSESLNAGPYITVSYNDPSEFTIATNNEYPTYEEFETAESMGVTVDFRCTGGSTNTLVFYINVMDTNNNAPQFKPHDNYHFKVIPPIPPGFSLTDCINDIIVRDIDLTTLRIDFEIEENPYFEIANDLITVPKEFKAIIRSTAFIRRIPEPIILLINATDVDGTGDPPLTTSATIRIEADGEYELPDDLIFSETFYLATYTDDNEVILEKDIYLQQGFDEQVTFSLDGANVQLFELDVKENRVKLLAKPNLPNDLLNTQIILILKANRQHTNGATATIIITLPEGPSLNFEKAYYKGSILDNKLFISNLTLLGDLEYDNVLITIFGDFANFFNASTEKNIISLQMNALDDNILIENNILTFQIVATINNKTAESIIVLEIIKDDFVTPIFEKSIYNGTYETDLGVVVEDIIFIQGYDDTVTVSIIGELKKYFQIKEDGGVFKISSSSLPSDILNEHGILLTLRASKPRTVGAHAVIYIAMPDARVLAFESLTYSGILVNESVMLETIELSVGYKEDVTFTLTGDYANYFEIYNYKGGITLNITNLPESLIYDNNILIFILFATVDASTTASTTIILQILKKDVVTPVFNQHIFNANYLNASAINVDNIYLVQGFNENTTFRLTGDYAQYFGISNVENEVTVFLESRIPMELIYDEKVLLFNIIAEKTLTVGANAVISVSFPRELTEPVFMKFSKTTYTGQIVNNLLIIGSITLSEGYSTQTEFILIGDHASLFSVTDYQNDVKIELIEELSTEVIKNNNFITLEIESFHPNRIKAQATIVLEISKELQPAIIPVFDRPYYLGEYSIQDKLQFNQIIQLTDELHDNVNFILEGENASWFNLVPVENGAVLELRSSLPTELLDNNQHLIFVVTAEFFNTSIKAQAAIIIVLKNDNKNNHTLRFENNSYVGVIENNILDLQPISLIEGYSTDVIFSLNGELASFFTKIENEGTVFIALDNAIPEDLLANYKIIILELQASTPRALVVYVTIVLEVLQNEGLPSPPDLFIFKETYYIGLYNGSESLIFSDVITLREEYDENVIFALIGENSIWFALAPVVGGVTILLKTPIPVNVLDKNRQLIFEITATKSNSPFTAKSAIIITHTFDFNDVVILGFEKSYYIGSVDNQTIKLETIILTKGFTENVEFTLRGELVNLFTIQNNASGVTITMQNNIPEEILTENQLIILKLEATAPEALSSYTIVVLEVIPVNDSLTRVLKFEEAYYVGVFTERRGLDFDHTIALTEDNDEYVEFFLAGENSIWFSITLVEGGALLILSEPIPEVILSQNLHLIFTIMARKPGAIDARSAIVISLPDETEESDVSFTKLVYKGVLRGSDVTHESISVSGYDGDNVDIFGGTLIELDSRSPMLVFTDHTSAFIAEINAGIVTVRKNDSTSIPIDALYIILELRVSNASGVLLIDIIDTEIPVLPTIRFTSSSYIIHVEMSQTGLIGLTTAIADNGETVTYSLLIQNDLREHLSISHNGELHLAAPASSGVHTFEVIATTVFTKVNGSATVTLIVEAAAICPNDIVVPPLIVIEREEESPHENLVTLNTTNFKECRYVMSNRWPIDQNWLYVDENGLHTRAIDREHESVAFMPVSQIQIELTLLCDGDDLRNRNKRSLNFDEDLKSLGPYDYGSSKWVLTDTILFNARRSFVNLIVQDINDNHPVFALKEKEPIVVGYPLPEIEETVLPRALVELKATDADIGENAALVYWSTETALAVSPSTGSVHVRSNAQVRDKDRLRVHVTDRNGLGLTGSIDIVVRLLNVNHIAVITINDAFFEDETNIITNLTDALRYEVKTLRSVVIPVDLDLNGGVSRIERSSESNNGPLLQLFIYGLSNSELVQVSKLVRDISNNNVMSNIARTVSLKEHLENLEICTIPVRNTALLAATIALSILLFVLILVFGVWCFLKWKNKFNYENFSDQKSLSSRDQFQLPTDSDKSVKPTLNFVELEKSEKRLHEILGITVEQSEQTKQDSDPLPPNEVPIETMVHIESSPEQRMPIVIQSIDKLKDAVEESDDEDEFGETKKAKRKSVVTFNENVEKIIHLEDNPNDPNLEVYRF